ncbi:MAG: 30S ribosomal protein S5 [Patescibacteria group bacterium]
MSEEKKQTSEVREAAVAGAVAKIVFGGNDNNNNRGGRGGQGGNQRGNQRGGGRFEKKDEMEQRILDIARVTRVMKGGKRMSFRACVALGDKKGTIGTGLGKGADVTMAVNKAVNQAKKHLIVVNMINDTIPHEVRKTIGAASIMFKPAQKGRGVIAGGVVRVILELAGVKNVTSKILGTNNKINNAHCTIEALSSLRKVEKKVKKEEKTAVK